MSAKIIVMQGNMVATIEETNKDAFLKRGEYKETELDKHKRAFRPGVPGAAGRKAGPAGRGQDRQRGGPLLRHGPG